MMRLIHVPILPYKFSLRGLLFEVRAYLHYKSRIKCIQSYRKGEISMSCYKHAKILRYPINDITIKNVRYIVSKYATDEQYVGIALQNSKYFNIDIQQVPDEEAISKNGKVDDTGYYLADADDATEYLKESIPDIESEYAVVPEPIYNVDGIYYYHKQTGFVCMKTETFIPDKRTHVIQYMPLIMPDGNFVRWVDGRQQVVCRNTPKYVN